MGTRIVVSTRASWSQLSPDDPTDPRTVDRMREIARAEARRWQHLRAVTVTAIDTATGYPVIEITQHGRAHCATCSCENNPSR